MRSALTLVVLALVGLFGATSIGYAAYVVSRDSVGLPVTKLKLAPNTLAPASAKRTNTKPAAGKTTTTPYYGDDHGGRSSSSGKGKGSDDKDD